MFDPQSLIAMSHVFARALGVAATAPGWGVAGVGWRLRLVLAGLLAMVLWPAASSVSIARLDVWPGALVSLSLELAVGVVLGLTGALVVAAIRQSGELIAAQAGISPASLLEMEPGAGASQDATPFAHLYAIVGLCVFLSWQGPLRLVDALARSYEALPIGLGLGAGDNAHVTDALHTLAFDLAARIGQGLGLAIQAAAPVGLALLVAGLAIAILARGQEGRSLSGMAWPLRWLIAVALAFICMPALAAITQVACDGWFVWISERPELSVPSALVGQR